MGLNCSNTAPQIPGTESPSDVSPTSTSLTAKKNPLDALRVKAHSIFQALIAPRMIAVAAAMLTLTGCATAPAKKITPLGAPPPQKSEVKATYAPAGTFEDKEMKIKFYHPRVKLIGRPVVVCFCNKKCTRWPDRFAFSGNCGHKGKDGIPQGVVILMDKAIFDSPLRYSEGGPKMKRVDETLKITALPPFAPPISAE